MTTTRSGFQLVSHEGYLYAIGGTDGTLMYNSVEKFDPKTQKWTLIANMSDKRWV